MATAEPGLTALMCDGMGWFRPVDYKRALLLYDRIHYLLPKQLVEFEDFDGDRRILVFPEHLRSSPLFQVVHFELDAEQRAVLQSAARHDAADPPFQAAVTAIPQADQGYSWRVVNADGGLGDGQSLAIAPSDTALAQAVLLNKFLLAADTLGHAPITGQSYLHHLIAAKYPKCGVLHSHESAIAGVPLRPDIAKTFHPVAFELSSTFISDDELDRKSEEQILEYKERYRALFYQFSSEILELTASIGALPGTRDFDAALRHALQTTVWQRRAAIQDEFRATWQSFFKTGALATVAGLVGIGVAPQLPLGALVAGAAAAAGTWAIPGLIDVLFKIRKARVNGFYYLMGFSGA